MRRPTRTVMAAMLAGLVVFCLAAPSRAGLITLVDGDVVVEIDPDAPIGVFNWQLGETSHLAHEWFWFRNSLDEFDDREYSIDEISAPVVDHPIPRFATVSYTEAIAEPRFSVEVTYILTGGAGAWSADLAEIIEITNLDDSPMVFNFFEYADFDLGGDVDDMRVWIEGGNTVFQSDLGGLRITLSETVASGGPDLSEVGIFPATLNKLTDLGVDELDGTTQLSGPADLTWAFQWKDRVIQPGHALMMSKDKVLTVTPVPEPGCVGLIGTALLVLRRKRK